MRKQKEYFCKVVMKDGSIRFGIRKAPTSDLAMSCFMQDEGIDENDSNIGRSTAYESEFVLIDRLLVFIDKNLDPWSCDEPFLLRHVSEVDDSNIEDLGADKPWDPTIEDFPHSNNHWFHASRVLWLTKHPEYLQDPLQMDNDCFNGCIYPIPVILDGWHRFFAHRFLGMDKIPVSYSGRIDLLRYLTGKRKTAPSY